jgi:hypothetical protein
VADAFDFGKIPIPNGVHRRNSVRARSILQPLEHGTIFSGGLMVRLLPIYKIFAGLCQGKNRIGEGTVEKMEESDNLI